MSGRVGWMGYNVLEWIGWAYILHGSVDGVAHCCFVDAETQVEE